MCFSIFTQGNPGAPGLKGDSGDSGPQVRGRLTDPLEFFLHKLFGPFLFFSLSIVSAGRAPEVFRDQLVLQERRENGYKLLSNWLMQMF